jgi:transposase
VVRASLAVVRHESAKMAHRVQEHVEQSADVQHKQHLLGSIPGSGRWTAARVLAESDQVRASVHARHVAASAGFTPRARPSATSERSVRRQARVTKTGTSRLRRALYLPASVTMRHTPALRALAERLQARGKRPLEIVGAALRMLVPLLSGVLPSATRFDPGLATAACMSGRRSGDSRRPVVASPQKRTPGAQDLTRKTVSQTLEAIPKR